MSNVKVIPIIWPTKDNQGFYLFFVRMEGVQTECVLAPHDDPKSPSRYDKTELLDCLKGLQEVSEVRLYAEKHRPGTFVIIPSDCTRQDAEFAFMALCGEIEQNESSFSYL